MSDRHEGMDDWAVPAVLVGLGVGLLLVIGIAFAVSTEDQADARTLIEDLDAYTACLIDHGADVPRVESGRDGGFAVIVPGSVVEGGFDATALHAAADECAGVAPDIYVPDAAFDAESFRFDLGEDSRRRGGPGAGPWTPPLDELRRRCDQMDEVGIGVEGLRGDRLRRLCAELDR